MIHYTCESHVFTIFVTCANHVHFIHKVTDYTYEELLLSQNLTIQSD